MSAIDPYSPEFDDYPYDPAPGEFCHRHFSWLCQAGQGACQQDPPDHAPTPVRRRDGHDPRTRGSAASTAANRKDSSQ